MSRVEGHEDDINEMLYKIETMITARTATGQTRDDLEAKEVELELREEAVPTRDTDVTDRERKVASRENEVAQREQLQQITPPPPPAMTRRGMCDICGETVCSRTSPCFDQWGNDLRRHKCTACYRSWGSHPYRSRSSCGHW